MTSRTAITHRGEHYYIEEQQEHAGHWIPLRTLSRPFDTNEEALQHFYAMVDLGYMDLPIYIEETNTGGVVMKPKSDEYENCKRKAIYRSPSVRAIAYFKWVEASRHKQKNNA